MSDTESTPKQIAALERMTVGQLERRYAEVSGDTARSANRRWLFRRIAWRIRALAEGNLATRAVEPSRKLVRGLARDADLRLRPPAAPPPTLRTGAATMHMAIQRDERVPPPGTVLTRRFKGSDHRVKVLPNRFEHDGEMYRLLSTVAHAITGSHWNGDLFFRLDNPRSEEDLR